MCFKLFFLYFYNLFSWFFYFSQKFKSVFFSLYFADADVNIYANVSRMRNSIRHSARWFHRKLDSTFPPTIDSALETARMCYKDDIHTCIPNPVSVFIPCIVFDVVIYLSPVLFLMLLQQGTLSWSDYICIPNTLCIPCSVIDVVTRSIVVIRLGRYKIVILATYISSMIASGILSKNQYCPSIPM